MINKSYAVLGLGRYGSAVARELSNSGVDVLAVDIDEVTVNAVAGDLPICKCADITDPEAIEKLGIGEVDVVVVAMASNIEASVMAITLCKEAGVKTVIAKCAEEMHGKIYKRVGADKVVFPEEESGKRLAKNLLSSGFVDMMELSSDVSIVELDVKNDWVGKSLIELNVRKKYGINIVAIRKDDGVQVNIDPEAPLESNMKLIVIANTAKLAKLTDK